MHLSLEKEKNMTMCKSCILAMALGAVTASAVTAAMLSRPCSQSRRMRHNINHAVKSLTHAVEDMM